MFTEEVRLEHFRGRGVYLDTARNWIGLTRRTGHFAYGGDPARDLYISPADPAFWLHHTMFDKVWWLWQMQDPENRIFGNNTVAGTNTMMDTPASANTTVDDYVEYGYAAGPPRQIKDLLSTMDGPFCYIYE